MPRVLARSLPAVALTLAVLLLLSSCGQPSRAPTPPPGVPATEPGSASQPAASPGSQPAASPGSQPAVGPTPQPAPASATKPPPGPGAAPGAPAGPTIVSLETDSPELFVIPGLRVPLWVYGRRADGSRVLLDPSALSLEVAGVSGSFQGSGGGKGVVRVFEGGDVGPGTLVVRSGGLSLSLPFSLARVGDPAALDRATLLVSESNRAYSNACADFTQARQVWQEAVRQPAAPESLLYSFHFPLTWGEVLAGATKQPDRVTRQETPGVREVRYPAESELILGSVRFSLGPRYPDKSRPGQYLDSIRVDATVAPRDPQDRPRMTIGFWGALAGTGQATMGYLVGYLGNPEALAGRTWEVPWELKEGIVPEVLPGDYERNLADINITYTTRRYTTPEAAEQALIEKKAAMLQEQRRAVDAKLKALEELRRLEGLPDSGLNLSDILKELEDRWNQLKDSGAVDFFEEQRPELEGLSDKFDQAQEYIGLMKNATSLFEKWRRVDTLSAQEQVEAIRSCLELGRALAPGGGVVDAIGPFLDFYSQALEAIGDALGKIETRIFDLAVEAQTPEYMRDPAKREQVERAIKIRQLLEQIKDP